MLVIVSAAASLEAFGGVQENISYSSWAWDGAIGGRSVVGGAAAPGGEGESAMNVILIVGIR